jgi:hypothetical protein
MSLPSSLSGAVVSLYGARNGKVYLPLRNCYQQALEIARASLDEKAFGEAFATGQTMSLEEATVYA